jgi:hypothetical protein
MFANAAAPKLDESQHSFAATSAARLSRLQLRPTLIAKHCSSLTSTVPLRSVDDTKDGPHGFRVRIPKFPTLDRQTRTAAATSVFTENQELTFKTKRPPGNWAAFSFKGE